MTYRENINILIKRLRRIQLISLLLILTGVVLTVVVWNVYESDQWYSKVIILIGIIGEFYCWAKVRQIKCPQCRKNLGYLLLDPSYSKTNGAILLPKELPPDRHCCAYCKASFDDENLIELYLNLCQKCNFGENMQALNEYERVIYVTQLLEEEVNNGGFDQFFVNSSGNLSNEIVTAFTRIGALKTAAICEKAISVFPSPVPATQEERNQLLSDEKCTILDRYDDEFYNSEENLDVLNRQYIKEHKDWF